MLKHFAWQKRHGDSNIITHRKHMRLEISEVGRETGQNSDTHHKPIALL